MHEAKKRLRAAVRRASGSVPAADGIAAAERIEALPGFASARTVALYHALPGEVPTAAMLERWRGVKRLALPVAGGDGAMVFREYTGGEDLGSGAFGIREPLTGGEIPPEEIDFMIVPGLAFDAQGRRLGHGKGFYDRYLARPSAAHIYKTGLCPPHGSVAEVPSEPHDIKMDKIIVAN